MISLSLLLFITGWVVASFFISSSVATGFKEKINIIAELPEDFDQSDRTDLINHLKSKPEVIADQVQYIDKEQALQVMQKDLGASILSEGIENPFREIVEFHLHSESLSLENLQILEKELKETFGIEGLYYPPDLFSSIQRTFQKITLWGMILIGVLLIIITMLIHQIMKMNIISNRFVIRTMEMVGAKPGFIRKPFVRESVKLGFISSLLAIAVFSLVLYFLGDMMQNLGLSLFSRPYLIIVGCIAFLGFGICIFSSRLAVNRYLGSSLDALYV
jgi:cell division transport system permease protein